jgi:hypothetical protein
VLTDLVAVCLAVLGGAGGLRSCMNHTEGSWEMTEPLTQFLMDHL